MRWPSSQTHLKTKPQTIANQLPAHGEEGREADRNIRGTTVTLHETGQGSNGSGCELQRGALEGGIKRFALWPLRVLRALRGFHSLPDRMTRITRLSERTTKSTKDTKYRRRRLRNGRRMAWPGVVLLRCLTSGESESALKSWCSGQDRANSLVPIHLRKAYSIS